MDDYSNLDMNTLPSHIAKDAEIAADNSSKDSFAEIEKKRLKLEEKRMESEERIAERNAERDENVADSYSGANEYRTLLDQFIEQFRQLSSGVTQHVEIQPATAIDPASEDVEKNSSEEDGDIDAALPPAVEEIGGSAPEIEPEKEVEGEVENASTGGNTRHGRKTRRR